MNRKFSLCSCHNPSHQEGDEADGGRMSQRQRAGGLRQGTADWIWSPLCDTTGLPLLEGRGWARRRKRRSFKETGLENDIMVPRVCEHDSILKSKGDKEHVVQASGFQEKRGTSLKGLAAKPTCWRGVGGLWAAWLCLLYFTGPKKNEAQRLWWGGNCRRGWGTQLPKLVCNGQGAKLTWTSTDKCSLLSLHHILQSVASGNTHTHTLPLNSNCDLREIQILFAYSCEPIALLFIKALEVLLSLTNPTWFWKRKVLK